MKLWNKGNLLSVFIVAFCMVVFIRVFVFEAFFVKGDSMNPTILDGDYVLVNKLAYLFDKPERTDIIVATPRIYKKKIVKRIIGMPNERFQIKDERILIKSSRTDAGIAIDEMYLEFPNTPEIGKTETNIDPEEYFVLGDNRQASIDSRELGMINSGDIDGRVFGVISFKRSKYIGF